MHNPSQRLQISLKGAALVKLVEAGLIPSQPDGSVDTACFDLFWDRFSGDIDAAFDNQLLSLAREGALCQAQKDLFRHGCEHLRKPWQGGSKHSAEGGPDHRVLPRRLPVLLGLFLGGLLGCFGFAVVLALLH